MTSDIMKNYLPKYILHFFSAFEIVQLPIYKVLSFILVILIHNSVDGLMSILLSFNRTEKIETWAI